MKYKGLYQQEKNGHLKQEEPWMPMAMLGFNYLVV